jgi:hypothetical protein
LRVMLAAAMAARYVKRCISLSVAALWAACRGDAGEMQRRYRGNISVQSFRVAVLWVARSGAGRGSSPLYRACISPESRLYLPYISPTSRLALATHAHDLVVHLVRVRVS